MTGRAMDDGVGRRLADRIHAIESAHRELPFPVETHSTMLGDGVRLAAFEAAIAETVHDPARVVDIGTGTGILAAYAARRTTGQVVGIDVSTAALAIAASVISGTSLGNIELHAGLSYGALVETAPDIVICELLGPCGVEEDIVEVAHEFATRYPSVRRTIPEEVDVLAQPIRSAELQRHYGGVMEAFDRASNGDFDYGRAADLIERSLSETLIESVVEDAELIGQATLVARFRIGHSPRTVIDRVVNFGSEEFDFVHLYFEAQLSPSVRLSTGLDAPRTHWQPRFVRRRDGHCRLSIRYVRPNRRFDFAWQPSS
jgi:SAM-dependent methyltransferase